MNNNHPISSSIANLLRGKKVILTKNNNKKGKGLFINGSFAQYQSSKELKTLNTTLSTFNSQYEKYQESHRQLRINNSNFSKMYQLFYAQTEGSSIKNLQLPTINYLSNRNTLTVNKEEDEGDYDENDKVDGLPRNLNKIQHDNTMENIFSSSLILLPNKKIQYLSETQSTNATYKSEKDFLDNCIKRISRPDLTDNEYYTALRKLQQELEMQKQVLNNTNEDIIKEQIMEEQPKRNSKQALVLNLNATLNNNNRITLRKSSNKKSPANQSNSTRHCTFQNHVKRIDCSFESIESNITIKQGNCNKTAKASATINFETINTKGTIHKEKIKTCKQPKIIFKTPIVKEAKPKREKTESLLKVYDKVKCDEKTFKSSYKNTMKVLRSNKSLIMNYFKKHSCNRIIDKMKTIEHEDGSNILNMILPAQIRTENTDIHQIINDYEYKNGIMNFNKGKLCKLTDVNYQIATLDKQSIRNLLKR